MVWLTVSVMTALMTKATPDAGGWPSSAAGVLPGLFDGVVAAAMLPGAAAVVLGIVGAVITGRDVRRCGRPAEHGDHFYPWSKGGSTSLQNFVSACAKCNRATRARIPSPGQQQRMERRRRDYLSPSSSVSGGERQPLP
jgi:hypothetical protein